MASGAESLVRLLICLRQPSNHARIARRAFSTSSLRRKHGPLPAFDASTQELGDLLSTIRSKIVLPAHLNIAQQKLIYRTRHHAMLRTDPFVVEIGGERIQLEPIDRTHDVPDSWTSTVKAIDLMKKGPDEDWRNLYELLTGMRTAGRRWKHPQWERIVREAGEGGACRAILNCVRGAERTGLWMDDIRLIREIMWAARVKAIQGKWDQQSTDKALRYAQQISRLFDDRSHRRSLAKSQERLDPRRQPDIIGVVLELATAHAKCFEEGSADRTGALETVKIYLIRLLSSLDSSELVPQEDRDITSLIDADYELLRWIPLYSGMNTANDLLGSSTPEQFVVKQKLSELGLRIKDSRAFIEKSSEAKLSVSSRRGLEWLKDVHVE